MKDVSLAGKLSRPGNDGIGGMDLVLRPRNGVERLVGGDRGVVADAERTSGGECRKARRQPRKAYEYVGKEAAPEEAGIRQRDIGCEKTGLFGSRTTPASF